jgi:putative nucleotidyltransferase with HDIG domain
MPYSENNIVGADATEEYSVFQTEQLKAVVGRIDNIPTLPTVVAQVTEAIRDPRVDASHVGQIISRDQALAAKTLRLVNSAFYGFPRKINNITRAIIVMGFNKVRNLALTASVLDAFKSRDKDFDYAGLWKHSLGTAIAAEVLAKAIKSSEIEDAFVTGLLHDIGKLVMALYAKDAFARIRDHVEKNDVLMLNAEMELFEIDHGLVGAWLADEWKFPQKLARAIRLHHNPEAAREYQEIIYITHVADILCRALEIGNGGDKRIPQMSRTVWDALKLNDTTIDSCMTEIYEGLDKAKDFLDLLK